MADSPASVKSGVPVLRFYTVIVIMFVIGYFTGSSAGKADCEYKTSQRDLERQDVIYESDIELDATMPNVRDTSEWAKWMKKHGE
mgnify:CR=1 FL=1